MIVSCRVYYKGLLFDVDSIDYFNKLVWVNSSTENPLTFREVCLQECVGEDIRGRKLFEGDLLLYYNSEGDRKLYRIISKEKFDSDNETLKFKDIIKVYKVKV